VVAVPSPSAVEVLEALGEAGTTERLTTLLLVSAPNEQERAAAADALARAGAGRAVALAVHAPSGARVLWAECRGSAGATGLHTYPDLEVVQLVDPESGEAAADSGPGELVLTQLGLRGSALLRWRTGDLVTGVDSTPCPGCGRTVPRVSGTARGALVVGTGSGRALDLRAVAGALAGRADLQDWRVVVGGRSRDNRGQVVVHVLPRDADAGEAAVGAAADIRAAAGMLPSQIVVTASGLEAVPGTPLSGRLLRR
jgi:hypothetical protein